MNGGTHAVFPLNTVLFPGGLLPLRIFETRYLDMIARCAREDVPFVVCLIRQGEETGHASYHALGTGARIVDWDQGADGLLHVRCLGERRARVTPAGVQADGLNLATVEWLDEGPPVRVPDQHRRLATVLGNLIAELSIPVSGAPRLEDAAWVAGRLAEFLPLEFPLKQRLLETDDAVERLDLIAVALPKLAGD